MRATMAGLGAALALTAAAAASAQAPAAGQGSAAGAPVGPGLVIRDAAVRVVVTPENRSDVVATVSGGASSLPRLQLRREGGTLVVDGGLRDRIRGCGAHVFMGSIPSDWADPVRPDRHGRVRIDGMGQVRLPELPFLDVRVPMDVRIEANGAVYGAVGRSRGVSMTYRGCGKWTVGNTEGVLAVDVTGSGDVNAGTAARAEARVRGSGDVRLVSAAQGLSAEVIGSGDIRVQRADGPMSLRVNGSGDVRVSDGAAQGLEAEVRGSGDVRVAAADGAVRLTSAGSGDVRVGSGRASEVQATVRGSGDVVFDGEAQSASVQIAGSGDVRLGRVSGQVQRTVRGSGDLVVDGRTLTD